MEKKDEIEVTRLEEDNIQFRTRGPKRAFINALRQHMMQHTPTLALDNCIIKHLPAGVLEAAVLVARMREIPLVSDAVDEFRLPQECCISKSYGNVDSFCSKCGVLFELDVTNDSAADGKRIIVTSSDLKPRNPYVRVRPIPHVTITKLAPGQRLQLEIIARRGTLSASGMCHNPVAVCHFWPADYGRDYEKDEKFEAAALAKRDQESKTKRSFEEDDDFYVNVEVVGQHKPEQVVLRGLVQMQAAVRHISALVGAAAEKFGIK